MKRLPWILLAFVALIVVLSRDRIELLTTGRFACTREAAGERKVWGAFKPQPDGPELIACFGGLMRGDDNRKACEASLTFLQDPIYCALLQ